MTLYADHTRDELVAEIEDYNGICVMLSDILVRTAKALKGAPKPLQRHSWHDLPEVAQKRIADSYAEGVESVAKMIERKAEHYAIESGHDDMGGLSFGAGPYAMCKADYHNSLLELADEIREMHAASSSEPEAPQ